MFHTERPGRSLILALASCSAPPLPGGWGYDIGGIPNTLKEAPDPLRVAFCEAQTPACASAEAYDPPGGS